MASSATADIATVEMSTLNLPTDNFTAAPLEISFLMPRSLDTTIHLRISFLGPSTMLFLTTTSMGSSQAISPLGSFVYAMPDVQSCLLPSFTLLTSATAHKPQKHCLHAIVFEPFFSRICQSHCTDPGAADRWPCPRRLQCSAKRRDA